MGTKNHKSSTIQLRVMGREHVQEVDDNFCDMMWLQFRGFGIHNKVVMEHIVSINSTTYTINVNCTDEYVAFNICSYVLRLCVHVQLLITWNINLCGWDS